MDGDTTYLPVDMLERSVFVLAVTDAVTSHAGVAGPFFSLDDHFGIDLCSRA